MIYKDQDSENTVCKQREPESTKPRIHWTNTTFKTQRIPNTKPTYTQKSREVIRNIFRN